MRPSVPRCRSSWAFVPQRGGFQLRVLPCQLSGRNRPSVKRLSSPKAEFLIHFFGSLPFPRIAPYQISHSEKFDNPLSLNGPVDADRPIGSVSLARHERGRSPGTTADELRVRDAFLSPRRGLAPPPFAPRGWRRPVGSVVGDQ